MHDERNEQTVKANIMKKVRKMIGKKSRITTINDVLFFKKQKENRLHHPLIQAHNIYRSFLDLTAFDVI